jgi:two-component system, OmpR family, sensor histidine kinase KdpD
VEIPAERPTAEEMLERVRRQAGAGARGRLRVYLGMAPGVGKTFAMLNEGRRRKERGTDVVVGFVETYGRPQTIAAVGNLEVVPRKKIPYKGVTLEELDAQAVIERSPDVALVDELAHTNAPGSTHPKRWQDVQELLDAGITVLSTVNIQHVESLADIVETITGVAVRERIPDKIIDDADEVELVDITPHGLRQRIRHGNVYPPERAAQALHQFFREGNLNALRELALRKVSTTVEDDLEEYMRQNEIETVWPAAERVMVAIDEKPASQHLIRRGWREATRAQTQLLVTFVETPAWTEASAEARRSVEDNIRFAEDLGAEVIRVAGRNVARALAQTAHDQNAGTIVVGHMRRSRLRELIGGSLVRELMAELGDVDLRVVSLDGARSDLVQPIAEGETSV